MAIEAAGHALSERNALLLLALTVVWKLSYATKHGLLPTTCEIFGLVVVQTGRALDDVADMFVRLVQKLHNHAYDALLQHQADHVERTDSLVAKADRHEWISVVRDEKREDGSTEQVPLVGLSMITEKWWPVVTGSKNQSVPATSVLRRPFEMCVLTEVMQDLRSGDLCIPGSDRYRDYRGQLVTEEEYRNGLA